MYTQPLNILNYDEWSLEYGEWKIEHFFKLQRQLLHFARWISQKKRGF